MTTAQTQPPLTGSPQPPPLHPQPAGLKGAAWKWGMGLLMCYVIYGAFFIAKNAIGFVGDSARIIFFHVPCAVLSSIAYFVAAAYAGLYLFSSHPTKRFHLDLDAKAAAAMELGFVFCILATVTGSVFAGMQWGTFWNWDPREISIVGMLLLYAAYLVLRSAGGEQPDKRARLTTVYILITLIPTVFLIWVVPRIQALQSLHPTSVLANPKNTSAAYKEVLYPSFLAFILLFTWLFQLRFRLYKLANKVASR
ncbi:MAG TPA: cytochrome c biogenesis protein CcsA [Chthonomonadaceae bacterium]|nr:cytochrome c biogenesis protein CcsA [Chthonomonadaceae bacterium]